MFMNNSYAYEKQQPIQQTQLPFLNNFMGSQHQDANAFPQQSTLPSTLGSGYQYNMPLQYLQDFQGMGYSMQQPMVSNQSYQAPAYTYNEQAEEPSSSCDESSSPVQQLSYMPSLPQMNYYPPVGTYLNIPNIEVNQKKPVTTKRKSATQPGPIPASELILEKDNEGKEWLKFSYTKNKVVTQFRLMCPTQYQLNDGIDNTLAKLFGNDFDRITNFKLQNCIYIRAMVPESAYQGNRYKYESSCNEIGWYLCLLNENLLSGQKGLIQRAVDSWRNTRKDNKLKSRRVRKIINLEKSTSHQNTFEF